MQTKQTMRVAFTPWKLCICLLAVGLMIGTCFVLDWIMPGDTDDAIVRRINGGMQFSIKSMKSAWMEIALVISFFGYPSLLSWWFWKQLSGEYERNHGKPIPQQSRVGNIADYIIIGFLVALALLLLAVFVIREPLTKVHRVTIHGDDVRVESLYRSWQLSRRDIGQVEVTRDAREGRGGPYVEHEAVIHLQGPGVFRTADIRARPPGGQQDQQYGRFFSELRDCLTKQP